MREEDRDVFIEQERPDQAMNAIGFQSPLSIDESLDVLVPALSAAVDGDPATVPLDAKSQSAAMPSPIHRGVTSRTR